MTANLLNAALGLWLVYVAVLAPAWAAGNHWRLPLAGALVVALALWARSSDRLKWHSTVNVVLGAALLGLAALHWENAAPPLLMFWGLFWPGVLVPIVALWAAFYRPGSGPAKGDQRDAGQDEEGDRAGVANGA